MPLPTLISEYSGEDEAGHVFDVIAHMPNGDMQQTQVFADNHDDALHLAACEWEIEDYAFKQRGDNPAP